MESKDIHWKREIELPKTTENESVVKTHCQRYDKNLACEETVKSKTRREYSTEEENLRGTDYIGSNRPEQVESRDENWITMQTNRLADVYPNEIFIEKYKGEKKGIGDTPEPDGGGRKPPEPPPRAQTDTINSMESKSEEAKNVEKPDPVLKEEQVFEAEYEICKDAAYTIVEEPVSVSIKYCYYRLCKSNKHAEGSKFCNKGKETKQNPKRAVSYTHLTLPTKRIV